MKTAAKKKHRHTEKGQTNHKDVGLYLNVFFVCTEKQNVHALKTRAHLFCPHMAVTG